MTASTSVRKACDSCRLRKIKCEPFLPTQSDEAACKPCTNGGLDCTYVMPVKRRGPPPKRRWVDAIGVTVAAGSSDSSPAPSHSADATYSLVPGKRGPALDTGATQSITIHLVCSQAVFEAIMQDYLDIIYPLVPVVHRPSFRSDLRHQRYTTDLTFLSFCFAICGLVLGILPRKFAEYNAIDDSLAFSNRREAVKSIHETILRIRPLEYFDSLTLEKWAISYMIGITNAHLRHVLRARILRAETDTICGELGLNRIATYAGLDCIETQLRKKAFWLNFTSHSHGNAHDVAWDRLADRFIFETADANALMPADVDDEYITSETIGTQPAGQNSVVAGFNALNRINNCLVSIIKDPSIPLLSSSNRDIHDRNVLGICDCGRSIRRACTFSVMQARLRKVRHAVSDLPAELRPWAGHSSGSNNNNNHGERHVQGEPGTDGILFAQYESMKANIHVTHLWIQSLLLEQLIAANSHSITGNQESADAGNCHLDPKTIWEMREDISKQLLHLLNNISQANLEPNGYILISKTRSVAATLLDYPFDDDDNIHTHRSEQESSERKGEEGGAVNDGVNRARAREYVKGFVDVLARLDHAYMYDFGEGVWDELEGRARVAPSTFWSLT